MIDTRITNLIEKIEQTGWKSKATDFKLEWWADTVIKFNSIWSTVNSSFFIIIKVDPQSSKFEKRKQGEDIWAIDISKEFPFNENSIIKSWTLKEIKTKTIEIIDFTNRLRK